MHQWVSDACLSYHPELINPFIYLVPPGHVTVLLIHNYATDVADLDTDLYAIQVTDLSTDCGYILSLVCF